jgi:hypothetical protein
VTYIEARLIVPAEPHPGSALHPEAYRGHLQMLERSLVRRFGGFTVTEGRGAWNNAANLTLEEPVRVYLFAFNGGVPSRTAAMLLEVRDEVKHLLRQRAVYLSHIVIEREPVE